MAEASLTEDLHRVIVKHTNQFEIITGTTENIETEPDIQVKLKS